MQLVLHLFRPQVKLQHLNLELQPNYIFTCNMGSRCSKTNRWAGLCLQVACRWAELKGSKQLLIAHALPYCIWLLRLSPLIAHLLQPIFKTLMKILCTSITQIYTFVHKFRYALCTYVLMIPRKIPNASTHQECCLLER